MGADMAKAGAGRDQQMRNVFQRPQAPGAPQLRNPFAAY